MTHRALIVVAIAALFGLPTSAGAERSRGKTMQVAEAVGSYDTKFEEVSNNCKDTGLTLTQGRVKLTRVKGRSIQLSMASVPSMRGAVRKGGKFRAKAKKGKTALKGITGRFSAGGRVGDGAIQFVFIAEYFRAGEPLCTQSWNATGKKK